jgi:hypothetical protein
VLALVAQVRRPSRPRDVEAAWKVWIASDRGRELADASTLDFTMDHAGLFRNRLYWAFVAGRASAALLATDAEGME